MTVTGAGGSGKTRLAVEVAAHLQDEGGGGAIFVELAPVGEPAQVPVAVASALGVREQGDRPLLDVLCEALAGQDLLLVLDNCEHVIGAAAELAERLTRACPRLRAWPPCGTARHRRRAGLPPGPAQLAPREGQLCRGPGGF